MWIGTGIIGRGIPGDNCLVLISKRLNHWACLNGLELAFRRQVRRRDNAARIGRFPQECPNECYFPSREDTEGKVGSW